MDFSRPASEEHIQEVAKHLESRGFHPHVVDTPGDADALARHLIPAGAEVMNATSVTVDESGFTKALLDGERYVALRKKIMELPQDERPKRGKHITAAPDWTVGSAHAVTRDGRIVFASASGSQIPFYAYTSAHYALFIGSQKIVGSLDDAFTRLHDYTLPLEDARAKKAYGKGSSINKVLILEHEPVKGRGHVILIRHAIGF